MTTIVRTATIADATRLTQLGANTFRETFEAENTPDDMASYLSDAFTPDRQAAEISDASGVVLLAERPNAPGAETLVGYAHLVSGLAAPAVKGPEPMELKRLYVTRSWHGKGVAQALMDAALDAARARGAKTLWLGVWERNQRAIAFYSNYGFTRVGEQTFVLGTDAQTDWLLARPL
jgi:ribosomal protein S18 acetylase RimI-like enzyme